MKLYSEDRRVKHVDCCDEKSFLSTCRRL